MFKLKKYLPWFLQREIEEKSRQEQLEQRNYPAVIDIDTKRIRHAIALIQAKSLEKNPSLKELHIDQAIEKGFEDTEDLASQLKELFGRIQKNRQLSGPVNCIQKTTLGIQTLLSKVIKTINQDHPFKNSKIPRELAKIKSESQKIIAFTRIIAKKAKNILIISKTNNTQDTSQRIAKEFHSIFLSFEDAVNEEDALAKAA